MIEPSATSVAAAVPPPLVSPRTRRFLLWLLVLTALALALRLWVGAELRRSPAVAAPGQATDMATYKALAMGILAGDIPDSFYYQPFYYALFLPLVFGVFGSGPGPTLIIQAVLGAGTVWLAGQLGARVFGRRAGLLAAALLTLSRFHIFYTPYLLLEVLSGFLWLLAIWLALHAYRRNSAAAWGGAALGLACAVLTRGNAILLLPAVLFLLVWRNWERPWLRLTARLLLFLLLFYAPQFPFALRNYSHFGRWTGPSSAAEAVLALGNNPQAPPGGLDYTMAFKEWMRQADLPYYERVPVARQIRAWIRAEPLAWLELKFRMFLLFWNPTEIPNNISYPYEARHSLLLRLPVLLDFAVLGVCGVAGVALGLRRVLRTPASTLLGYALATACLGTVLFYILARFRVPALPLIAVFGGAGLDAGLRGIEAWRRGTDTRLRFLRLLLVLALSYFFVLYAYPLYALHLERFVVRLARPHGVVFRVDPIVVCQDHTPSAAFAGWTAFEIPRGGLHLRKDFVLPAQARPARAYAVVRVPLLAPAGGRLRISGIIQGRTQREAVLELKQSTDAELFVLEVGEISPTGDAIRVELYLEPRPGPVYTLVDTHRWYGRTAILPAGAAQPQTLPLEACVDLLLLPPSSEAREPLPLPVPEDDAVLAPAAG